MAASAARARHEQKRQALAPSRRVVQSVADPLNSTDSDVSNSDTHRFVGIHDPTFSQVERPLSTRPGFNVHENADSAPRSYDSSLLIDNSVLVYIPMKLRCGVKVQCRPDVLARCPSVLRDLNRDVQGCLRVLPPSVHALVRRTQIWVNTTYYYGCREKPRNVNHSTAHHHEGWLFWARDKPEKATGIEIYNCFDYQVMRLHWNGCGLLLHEFCHLIHQFTLPDGLENTTVLDAFETATKSGLYDNTLRRDWAGSDCEEDMAYCMVNHKEFFAELSVTFLADSYTEFDEEPMRMEACCPPLMAPSVVERVPKGYTVMIRVDEGSVRDDESRMPLIESNESFDDEEPPDVQRPVVGSFQEVWQMLSRRDSALKNPVPHCNKFYPFTKGQFEKHDPQLYAVYTDLWTQIGAWRDEKSERSCFRLLRNCWPK